MNVDVSPSLSPLSPSPSQDHHQYKRTLIFHIAGTPQVKLKTFKAGDTLLSSISLDSVTVSQQSQAPPPRSYECVFARKQCIRPVDRFSLEENTHFPFCFWLFAVSMSRVLLHIVSAFTSTSLNQISSGRTIKVWTELNLSHATCSGRRLEYVRHTCKLQTARSHPFQDTAAGEMMNCTWRTSQDEEL